MIIFGKKAKRKFNTIIDKLSELQSNMNNVKGDMDTVKSTIENVKCDVRNVKYDVENMDQFFFWNKKCIEISTKIGCSNDCAYCPQEKFVSTYCKDTSRNRIMRFEDFKQALRHLPPVFKLVFSGMNEPFENPEAFKMLAYALEKGFLVDIFTSLKGLTLAQIEQLPSLNIKNIQFFRVHLPDSNGWMHLYPDNEYLNKLKAFSRIKFKHLDYVCFGTLHPDIPDYIAAQAICDNRLSLLSRAGNVNGGEKIPELNDINHCTKYAHITDINTKVICELRLTDTYEDRAPTHIEKAVLLPDGSLALCCMDFGLKHILGNLFKDPYESIMYGEVMQEIEKSMFCQNDKEILCRSCEWAVAFDEERWRNFCQTGSYPLS